MSAKTTLGRKAGSAIRGPRALERILIVAAIVAVLVAVGAWVAMNRPFGGAEAAGSESSTSTTDGTATGAGATDPATGAATDASSGDEAAAGAESSAAAADEGAAGTGSSDSGAGTGTGTGTGSGTGSSTGAGTGTGTTGGSGGSGGSSAPISPTTSFLTALAASGLAPPVDDAQKIAMAEDVCQELGYGSKYADVVRALTFAGASDAEATNFARLAITNLCSQHKIG